jgi:predicted SAM-dependent methyltransferase
MIRINIGCGRSPTEGWINFDNSPSIFLSKVYFIRALLKYLRIIDSDQFDFINFCRNKNIKWANAKKIPIEDSSAIALYSSHMLEHMNRKEVKKFISECYRVLSKNGVIRIVVPDLSMLIDEYIANKDADALLEKTLLIDESDKSLKSILMGYRGHKWMYDGLSLCKILKEAGFSDPAIINPGETRIQNHGSLNLSERNEESVYVEAVKK